MKLLNDNQNKYKTIFNKLPLGVLIIAKNGLITACNSHGEKLLNLPAEKIKNKPLIEFFPVNDLLERLFSNDSEIDQNISIGNKSFSLLAKKDPDLQEIIFTFYSNAKYRDEDNALKQLKIADLPINDILNSSQDEIFITDTEGKTLFINSSSGEFYGIEPKDLVGTNVSKLVERGFFSPSLFPIVKKRKEKVSMIQRTITGKTIHVIANPVVGEDGEMTHIIYTGRDITEIQNLKRKIERNEFLLNAYKSELEKIQSFNTPQTEIISTSPIMRKVLNVANRIAQVDSTILISGESGVGKGVIAKFIHDNSPRKENPMVHINCGAIPESLIESELFGYQSGAFTGADKRGRKGLFEQANGGTVFLDEIGEMPLNLQVRLLKVIQERKVVPVGGTKSIEIDIRVIAATNKNLKELVKIGQFREDLYYRLNVVPIHIPPLRERPEDVSHMIDYFLEKMNKKYNLSTFLSLEVENALIHHDWPGNVRELENLIERLIVTSEENEISIQDLPDNFRFGENDEFLVVKDIAPLKQAKEELEKQLIRKAYEIDRSSYKVADLLGINQSTAIRKINRYIEKK